MPATAQVRIAADAAQFRKTMSEVNKTFDRTAKKIGKLRAISKLVSDTLPKKLALAVGGIGLPGGLAASAKAYSKFQKDVAEVYTLMPNANKAFFVKMQNDALNFSNKFGMQTQNVTRGMYQAISAGISPDTLMEEDGFLGVAAKSAVAGVTDLRTAVDSLTNVVNSYGKGVYDMQSVSDMMFKAVSMSKTTFREMADYLYQILPTAGSLKLGLDQLLGSISALAAQGTLTRVATTQLRQMLIELGRSGDKANQAFLSVSGGLPVQQFIRDGGKMTEIIQMMGLAARRRGTDIRNLFGSVEAGNAAISLFNSLSFKNMVDALKPSEVEGETSKAFDKIFNTLSFQFDLLSQQFFNYFKKVGGVLEPILMDIVKFVRKQFIEAFDFDFVSAKEKFAKFYDALKKEIKKGNLAELIANSIIAGVGQLKDILLDLFSSLKGIYSVLGGLFNILGEGLSKLLSAFPTDLKNVLNAVMDGMGNGFINLLAKVKSSALDIINELTYGILDSRTTKKQKVTFAEEHIGHQKIIQAVEGGTERGQQMRDIMFPPLAKMTFAERMYENRGHGALGRGMANELEQIANQGDDATLHNLAAQMRMAQNFDLDKGKPIIPKMGVFLKIGKMAKDVVESLEDVGTAVPKNLGLMRNRYEDAMSRFVTATQNDDDLRDFAYKQDAGSMKESFKSVPFDIELPASSMKQTYEKYKKTFESEFEKLRAQSESYLKGVFAQGESGFSGLPESNQTDYSDAPKPEEFNYRTKMGKVVSDSLQRIGGGGSTSSFINPMDRNTDAIRKNTEAVRNKTKDIVGSLDLGAISSIMPTGYGTVLKPDSLGVKQDGGGFGIYATKQSKANDAALQNEMFKKQIDYLVDRFNSPVDRFGQSVQEFKNKNDVNLTEYPLNYE